MPWVASPSEDDPCVADDSLERLEVGEPVACSTVCSRIAVERTHTWLLPLLPRLCREDNDSDHGTKTDESFAHTSQSTGKLANRILHPHLRCSYDKNYPEGIAREERLPTSSACGNLSLVKRWLVRAFWAAVLIFATVVIGGAVDARRRLPDLETWHRYVPADATASDLESATLADYLRREETVFRDVHDRIERTSAGSASPPANRYDSRSRSHPSRMGSDRNRTYEIVPDRRDCWRGPSGSRSHRLAVQHARGRRNIEGERLLRSGAADARARHRAGRRSPPLSGRTGSPPSVSASATCGNGSVPASRWCSSATRTAVRSC